MKSDRDSSSFFFSKQFFYNDASSLWQGLAFEPGFSFLDSSDTSSIHSTKSIIGIRPFLQFSSTQNGIILTWRNGKVEKMEGDPFEGLSDCLRRYAVSSDLHIPGGAMGYVSYDACRHMSDFSFIKSEDSIPDLFFGFYDVVLVIDHAQKTVHIQGQRLWEDSNDLFHTLCRYVESPRDIQAETPFHVYHPKRNIEKTEYLKKIDIIKGYIDKGDVYQVNFSYRHHVEFSGPLSELYRRLRHNAPAPFSAYLSVGDVTVLSTSPERFFKLDGRHVVTSPIKGTRPRFGDNRDPGLQEDLLQSEKDNAELLMIVDLERNDLNTICKTGTVHVSCLKRLEQFQHVIHLVADVEGELLDDVTQVQVLQALFPGGSITGAPKIRAMEIISELETLPRALYTGCLGYFSFSGPSEFNIAIRSLYAKDQKMYFHTGGGIVADSDGDLEWEESRAKAKGILLALGIKEGI